jgi:hypothetical protein
MGVEPPYVAFELDPAVSGADFSIVAYMLSRYYSAPRATQPARSCASTRRKFRRAPSSHRMGSRRCRRRRPSLPAAETA